MPNDQNKKETILKALRGDLLGLECLEEALKNPIPVSSSPRETKDKKRFVTSLESITYYNSTTKVNDLRPNVR